jgi:hypothetical protein
MQQALSCCCTSSLLLPAALNAQLLLSSSDSTSKSSHDAELGPSWYHYSWTTLLQSVVLPAPFVHTFLACCHTPGALHGSVQAGGDEGA